MVLLRTTGNLNKHSFFKRHSKTELFVNLTGLGHSKQILNKFRFRAPNVMDMSIIKILAVLLNFDYNFKFCIIQIKGMKRADK